MQDKMRAGFIFIAFGIISVICLLYGKKKVGCKMSETTICTNCSGELKREEEPAGCYDVCLNCGRKLYYKTLTAIVEVKPMFEAVAYNSKVKTNSM